MNEIKMTDNYKVTEVAHGIYAVISTFMLGHGYCNSAIVDLGDKCIIYDTLGNPATAKEIIELAHELTGNSIIYLIDSHWHWDHVWGNQSFTGAIFSTIKTRELLKEENQNQLDAFKKNLPEFIDKAEKEHGKGINGKSLFGFVYENLDLFKQHIETLRYLHDSLDGIDLKLPDFTFEKRMQIWGTNRHVELHAFHGLHSPSDTVMYIPDSKTLIAGDLVVSDMVPFSFGEEPLNYASIFEELQNLEISNIIPGHGDVTDKTILPELLGYWKACHEKAEEAIQSEDQDTFISNLQRPQQIPSFLRGDEKAFQTAVQRFIQFGLKK